jgi:hypothetical protein
MKTKFASVLVVAFASLLALPACVGDESEVEDVLADEEQEGVGDNEEAVTGCGSLLACMNKLRPADRKLSSNAGLASDARDRNAQCGFNHSCDTGASVLYRGGGNAAAIVTAWERSPGHNSIIRNTRYSQVGCAKSGDVTRCLFR